MSRTVRHQPAALLLALAILAQGVLLIVLDQYAWKTAIQALLISLALAVAVHEVWRNRLRLDHRLDMFLTMLAFGGLGMLIGTGVDLAQAQGTPAVHGAAALPGATAARSELPPCCAGILESTAPAVTAAPGVCARCSMKIGPDAGTLCAHCAAAAPAPGDGSNPHAGGLTWSGFWQSIFSWMTGLMLLGGIVPSLFMTRCARLANLNWRRWAATHLLGNLGMLVGMILAGVFFGHPLGMKLGAMISGHHLAMLAGMLIGMELVQFVAEAALGLRPWRAVPELETTPAALPHTAGESTL